MTVPLLITTALAPPEGVPSLAMAEGALRVVSGKAALFWWAAQGVRRIVVADATGQELLGPEDVALLARLGVELEQIQYQQDAAMVLSCGKGRAEGELIDFALGQSRLIAEAGHFYKCTGKVICRNFAELDRHLGEAGIESVVWKQVPDGIGDATFLLRFAELRFYRMSVGLAREFLLHEYAKANDTAHTIAEYCVAMAIEGYMNAGHTPRPMLSGFSGGSGGAYFEGSLGVLDAAMPCWVANAA